MARSFKKLRDKLMAEDPHCHWCSIEVIYYKLAVGEKFPKNFATIDHIYTKLEWEQRLAAAIAKDPTRHVLACYKCNSKRNKETFKTYNKEAWKIRTQLGQQRKQLGSIQPRPQVFRGLENI